MLNKKRFSLSQRGEKEGGREESSFMASSNFNTVLKLHMLKGQYIQVLKEKTTTY